MAEMNDRQDVFRQIFS